MEDSKHKNLDQVFRDKLQDYEVAPPAQIWEGIQSGGLNVAAASSNSWRWWAAAGVLALILGTSYFYFSSDSNTESSLSKQNTEANSSALPEQTSTEETSSPSIVDLEEVEQEVIEEMENSFPVEEQIIAETTITELPTTVKPPTESTSSEAQNSISVETEIRDFSATLLDAKESVILMESNINIPSLVVMPNTSKAGIDFMDEDADALNKKPNKEKRWELGIEFSPEWITIPENDNNIKSYGLDFSARYHFSKWFVETGIGASLSNDDGIYKVDTISEFKGSYWDVYDVTFDESGDEPTPIYHTELKNVYENIDTNYVSRTENDYIYLNIPINVGYANRLNDKFAIYFKTGIINSFKIYENIPEFETVDNTDNNIIHSEARYFNRTPWNMQAQLNVGVNYYLSDKFIFGVEPNARYFIKSLVENNPGGNPYGFGVKIGFKYVIKK